MGNLPAQCHPLPKNKALRRYSEQLWSLSKALFLDHNRGVSEKIPSNLSYHSRPTGNLLIGFKVGWSVLEVSHGQSKHLVVSKYELDPNRKIIEHDGKKSIGWNHESFSILLVTSQTYIGNWMKLDKLDTEKDGPV